MSERSERFKSWLQGRMSLRLHMTMILAATFGGGIAATKVLLLLHVNVLWQRYAIACVVAYVLFLIIVKAWLMMLATDRQLDVDGDDVLDFFDGDDVVDAAGLAMRATALPRAAVRAIASPVPSKPSSSGSLPDLDAGGDDFVLAVLILLLIAVLLVAGIYLIWAAPAILGEAAFQAALAAALVRRTKKEESRGWIGGVVKSTIGILAVVLALSCAVGWYAQRKCPQALRLRDALDCTELRR